MWTEKHGSQSSWERFLKEYWSNSAYDGLKPSRFKPWSKRLAETHNGENSEEGKFPALRPYCDRQPYTHERYQDVKLKKLFCSVYNGFFCCVNVLWNQTDRISKTNSKKLKLELPRIDETPQSQILDSGNPINRLAEEVAVLTSQRQPQTSSALLKPTTMKTLISTTKRKNRFVRRLSSNYARNTSWNDRIRETEPFFVHLR